MKILIDDKIQASNAEDALKSPSLADTSIVTSHVITLDATYDIDCIGVGNTDATTITVNSEVVTLSTTANQLNGLYELVTALNTNTLTISHNGTYLGRFAAGVKRSLGASPEREPGFYTTQKPRVTASANIVEGAGGVSGRELNLDFRYKFTSDIFDDIESAFGTQISKGFPYFLLFDKETHRMPWERLYARDVNRVLFQSSVNRFLYSKRMKLIEAF